LFFPTAVLTFSMALILEKELSDILKKTYYKWKKGDITLQETHGLYFSAKKRYLAAQEEKRTKEVSELMLKNFFLAGRITEEFIEKWQKGKIAPTDKELELLKEGCEEVLTAFKKHFRKELLAYQKKPYNIHYAETKEKIRRIRKLIDAELAII